VERTAVRGRLTWQVATVASVKTETDSVRTIGLAVPGWPGHRAGQHLDVRLTAEDGYMAERSYSIATADGEVSPYLTGELRAGDQLEARSPGSPPLRSPRAPAASEPVEATDHRPPPWDPAARDRQR
jgi:hypothetical protein